MRKLVHVPLTVQDDPYLSHLDKMASSDTSDSVSSLGEKIYRSLKRKKKNTQLALVEIPLDQVDIQLDQVKIPLDQEKKEDPSSDFVVNDGEEQNEGERKEEKEDHVFSLNFEKNLDCSQSEKDTNALIKRSKKYRSSLNKKQIVYNCVQEGILWQKTRNGTNR